MAFQDDLAAIALEEWEWFGKDVGDADRLIGGKHKEAVEPYASRVGDYWLSIPSSSYDRLVKAYAKTLGKLDGTVTKLPWSAAFISYCFNMAGAGPQFPYSSGHATWINKAINNRRAKKMGASLVGFRSGETAVAIGDVFGRARLGLGVAFDNAPDFVKPGGDPVKDKGWYESHSDIVVEIDNAKRKAYLIGGNVGQSVAKVEIDLDANGHAVPGTGRYFVHIKNQISVADTSFVPSSEPPKAG